MQMPLVLLCMKWSIQDLIWLIQLVYWLDMSAMVYPRLDLAYSISVLSRYVKGSLDVGLQFGMAWGKVGIIGFVYANYADGLDKKRSTTSSIFMVCGEPVSWKSQLQLVVALSLLNQSI